MYNISLKIELTNTYEYKKNWTQSFYRVGREPWNDTDFHENAFELM